MSIKHHDGSASVQIAEISDPTKTVTQPAAKDEASAPAFRALGIPALAAAARTSKPHKQKTVVRELPAFLRDN